MSQKRYRRDAQDSNQNDSWTQLDNGEVARNVIPLNESGNPSSTETESILYFLKRILNQSRSGGATDVGQRQIVKIGALGGISGGAEITTTMPVSGTVGVSNLPTDTRFAQYDLARVKYATGMRANLAFT
jgi:hypothetical protein